MAGSSEKFEDLLFSRAQLEDFDPVQKHLPTNLKRAVRFQESNKHQSAPAPSLMKGRAVEDQLKPGSRRYRRFMKNVELLETALSDSEGEDFEIEVEFTVTFRSPFTVIFDDADFRVKWDPFIDITEEEEARLLALIEQEEALRREKRKKRDSTNPNDCWKKLSKYARQNLLDQAESSQGAIELLDRMLVDFVLSRGKRKAVSLPSSFQRLMCRCMAPFYSMKVQTARTGTGYTTTLIKTKNTQLPTTHLSDFLRSKALQHT